MLLTHTPDDTINVKTNRGNPFPLHPYKTATGPHGDIRPQGITGASHRYLRAPPGAMRPCAAPRASRSRALSETGTTGALLCRADLKAGTVGQRLRGDALRDSVPRDACPSGGPESASPRNESFPTPCPADEQGKTGRFPAVSPCRTSVGWRPETSLCQGALHVVFFWAGQVTVFSCAKVVSSVFARQGLLRRRG